MQQKVHVECGDLHTAVCNKKFMSRLRVHIYRLIKKKKNNGKQCTLTVGATGANEKLSIFTIASVLRLIISWGWAQWHSSKYEVAVAIYWRSSSTNLAYQ